MLMYNKTEMRYFPFEILYGLKTSHPLLALRHYKTLLQSLYLAKPLY